MDRSSETSQAELQTPSSHGTSFSVVLEWFLERVNTRFLSTTTPAQPRAGLIITTKLPFVAAITRRRCRAKTPSTLVRRDGKRERDEGVRADAGRIVKGQHRRLVERHGLPTTRGPLRDRGLNSAQECRGASPFQSLQKVKHNAGVKWELVYIFLGECISREKTMGFRKGKLEVVIILKNFSKNIIITVIRQFF